MPARLLLIDHAPIFGGSESFLIDLVGGLDLTCFAPTIITAPDSPVLEQFRATGVPTLTTPLPHINRHPLFLWRLWRAGAQLAQLAKRERADLMHSFTARAHLIGAVAARLSGVPLLWRLGDDTVPPALLQLFAGVPKHIVGVSRWLTAQYPRVRFDGIVSDGAPPPLNVTREAARAELGLPQDAVLVVHIGRLVRWKGQAVLIRALGQLHAEFPQLRGLIVGAWNKEDERPGPLGGGESYFHDLQTLSAASGLRDCLTFAGFVRHPGLAYAAADIVVHSSTLPEPFGRVVIEAMMAERPVVAARAGALPEIIVEGESGFLATPNDPADLAAVLQPLLASADLRARIGHQARLRVEAEFSLAHMLTRMQAAYDIALAQRP